MCLIPPHISLLRLVVFLMASAGSCAKRSSSDNNGRLSAESLFASLSPSPRTRMRSNTLIPKNGGSKLPRPSHEIPGLPSNNFKRDKPYSLKKGGTVTRFKSSRGGLTGTRDGGTAVEVAVAVVAGGESKVFFFLTCFDVNWC